ncbi:MAG: discoidin domain-containing protein [Eubacteriales bacterium]
MSSKTVLRIGSAWMAGMLCISALLSCGGSRQPSDSTTLTTDTDTTEAVTTETPSRNYPTTPQTPAVKNLSWEEGQIFPTFPAGSGEIDVILSGNLSDAEMITLTCLEGLVNAVETRFAVYVDNVETWAKVYGYTANKATTTDEQYAMIAKYAPEVSGVVLYSASKARSCADYINLATTVANINQAIPMTATIYNRWVEHGIELPVVADLTDLAFSNRLELYTYLYDTYWQDCTKRILFVQNPAYPQLRDLASAIGAAVIYLSCSTEDKEELQLIRKFFDDMTPGESILMGWNGQERELMGTAAKYGLSCVPADFFSAPSLFSQDLDVKINAVPDMPELENKIYIAFYFSDGDNIQYNMNAMKEYWDNNVAYRGQIPINWTISPALLEVAPGMMNYYYQSATENECFVCGPSGLGYTIPVNTFGANVGVNFTDTDAFAAYVSMTNRYLAATGLRTVTIWDNLGLAQREIYTSLGSYLYGLTVQHFTIGDLDIGYTGVVNDMLIQQMTPAYFAKNAEGTTKLTELGEVDKAVKYLGYDGTAPVFISVQVSVWAFHDVKEVIDFEQYLSDKYAAVYGEDVVEFVRADHYFNLYNQASGLPYDLTLRSDLSVSATSSSDTAGLVADGTQETVWEASEGGVQSLIFDLGSNYEVSELTLFFAESEGENYTAADNVRELTVEVSPDGENWIKATELADNEEAWVNLPFDPVTGRYLRIAVTDPGQSGVARIADVNINGREK